MKKTLVKSGLSLFTIISFSTGVGTIRNQNNQKLLNQELKSQSNNEQQGVAKSSPVVTRDGLETEVSNNHQEKFDIWTEPVKNPKTPIEKIQSARKKIIDKFFTQAIADSIKAEVEATKDDHQAEINKVGYESWLKNAYDYALLKKILVLLEKKTFKDQGYIIKDHWKAMIENKWVYGDSKSLKTIDMMVEKFWANDVLKKAKAKIDKQHQYYANIYYLWNALSSQFLIIDDLIKFNDFKSYDDNELWDVLKTKGAKGLQEEWDKQLLTLLSPQAYQNWLAQKYYENLKLDEYIQINYYNFGLDLIFSDFGQKDLEESSTIKPGYKNTFKWFLDNKYFFSANDAKNIFDLKYKNSELKTNIQEVRALVKNKQFINPKHKSLVKVYFTFKFFEQLIKKTKIDFVEQKFIDEVAYMKEVIEKRFIKKEDYKDFAFEIKEDLMAKHLDLSFEDWRWKLETNPEQLDELMTFFESGIKIDGKYKVYDWTLDGKYKTYNWKTSSQYQQYLEAKEDPDFKKDLKTHKRELFWSYLSHANKEHIRALYNSNKLKILKDGKWVPLISHLFPKMIYSSMYFDPPKSKEALKEIVTLSFEDWRWKIETDENFLNETMALFEKGIKVDGKYKVYDWTLDGKYKSYNWKTSSQYRQYLDAKSNPDFKKDLKVYKKELFINYLSHANKEHIRAIFNSKKLKVLENGKWISLYSRVFPKALVLSSYSNANEGLKALKEMYSISYEDWRWKMETNLYLLDELMVLFEKGIQIDGKYKVYDWTLDGRFKTYNWKNSTQYSQYLEAKDDLDFKGDLKTHKRELFWSYLSHANKEHIRAIFNSNKLKVLENGKWVPLKNKLFPKTIFRSYYTTLLNTYFQTANGKKVLRKKVNLHFEDWRWKMETNIHLLDELMVLFEKGIKIDGKYKVYDWTLDGRYKTYDFKNSTQYGQYLEAKEDPDFKGDLKVYKRELFWSYLSHANKEHVRAIFNSNKLKILENGKWVTLKNKLFPRTDLLGAWLETDEFNEATKNKKIRHLLNTIKIPEFTSKSFVVKKDWEKVYQNLINPRLNPLSKELSEKIDQFWKKYNGDENFDDELAKKRYYIYESVFQDLKKIKA